MSTFLLGIDLGSTSIKVILYDESGKPVAKSSKPMRRFHPSPENPQWTVWKPDEIIKQTASACRDVVAQIADPSDIKGIATTGMGMDGLPMTEEGIPLYPLISWHDPRTQPQYDHWIKTITAEKTFSIGGNPVWAINSALRMLWIKESEPEIYARTFKWLLIEDFVNHFLTDRFATDYSMASCTMLFDQRSRNWSAEMCNLSGISQEILPDVFASSTFLGGVTKNAASQTGLIPGTPVYLGGHDHICGSLPVGAFRTGTILNTTGTWEMVALVSNEAPLDTPLGKSGITVQSHVVPDAYMIWAGNPAGEMIEWYRREVTVPPTLDKENAAAPPDWETLVAFAESTKPGSDGILFLPHLDGSSCPDVDPRSRGVFIGLNTRTNHATLIRSIYEGLGFQLKNMVSCMEHGLGNKAKEIITVGGAIRNKFWMQNKADIIGLDVRVADVDEATVLGVAILAGIGAGIYRDAEDAFGRVAGKSIVYKPDAKLTEFYAGMFPIFQDLYSAAAPLHHKLSEAHKYT